MGSSAVACASRDGLSLEAELDGPEDATRALVLCHPHPQMGGTMSAPLLIALRDELVGRGWSVLRFNFRGIGKSEGQTSTGEPETADAAGAIDTLRALRPGLPHAIAGWSFGAAVAVRVAAEGHDLAACAGIAPALVARPGITAGLPPAGRLRIGIPLLFVCGSNDELVDPAVCRAWAEAAGGDFVEIPGANHFFWARYDRLRDALGDWLDATVPAG